MSLQCSYVPEAWFTWLLGKYLLDFFLTLFNVPAKPSLEDFVCFKICFPHVLENSKITLRIIGNHQKFSLNIFATARQ